MRIMDFLKPASRIQGIIGYHDLEHWWLTAFSASERDRIKAVFRPLGFSQDSLTSGQISYSSQSAISFLSGLAGWFYKPSDRTIAHRILDKASDLSDDADVLGRHFLYQQMIEIYYKDRQKPEFLEKALVACRDQIAMAPAAAEAFKMDYPSSALPSHRGYEQLAIVLEKQGRFREAIDCARQAELQGWCGDWSHRIKRCERKLGKT